MSEYDVAVIGAGAAGLAAGLRLQKSGRRFVVLEARDRIGGRAFTDTTSLGLPFDCGAHWLHAASRNPFTKIADRLGLRYNSRISFEDWVLFAAGREAPARVVESAGAYMDEVLTRIDAAGAAGLDVALSDFIETGNPWNMLVGQLIGQMTSHDPDHCSTLDSYRYEDEGGDFPVQDGYGALVARNAASLSVTLSTPVSRIDWSGRLVRLETSRGVVSARTIVLAVPVNVLAAEGIRFDPALPAPLLQALHDCPMGVSEKLAMLLDRPVEGLDHLYGDVVFPGEVPARTFNLHVNPFGRPLLVSHMAGSWGRDMERLGDAEAEAIAIEAAVEAFGSSLRKRVIGTLRTHWASDPWTLGGYSHAKPGRAASRLRFAEPVDDRIVLAGEHCSIDAFATVHGAHLSGIAAAATVIDLSAP